MNKVITGLLALALIGVTACGNGAPPPPPADGCSHSCSPKPTEETPKAKELGESYADKYSTESKAAFAADKKYWAAKKKYQEAEGDGVKEAEAARDEAYVVLAEHLYAALAFQAMHRKSGYTRSLPNAKKLKKTKAEFKTERGPNDSPRVKAAVKKWSDAIN